MLKKVFHRTSKGPYLEVNEDLTDTDVDLNLYSILDGFGGVGISDIGLQKVVGNIKKRYTHISLDPDSTLPFYFSPRYVLETNALINSFYATHQEVWTENLKSDVKMRFGTSLASLAISDHFLSIVSVGNIKILLKREESLKEIVSPENFENYAAELNHSNKFLTLPTNAIGLFEDVHLNVIELKPLKNDRLLLLTDGAYSQLHNEDVLKFLSNSKDSSDVVDTIFQMNNSKGNWDNQSALLLEF